MNANTSFCSLAWAELRLGLAHVVRKFDIEMVDPKYVFRHVIHGSLRRHLPVLTMSRPDSLPFRDTFLPWFNGTHLQVYMKPIEV